MELFQAGVLISNLRMKRGWTQEFLCKGICDKRTLARIEKGEHAPELFTFSSLMERLGEDPAKYYSGVVTIVDKMLIDLDEQLVNLLRKKDEEFDKEAEQLIAKHDEAKAKTKSKKYTQVLLSHKATLAFNRNEYLNAYELAIDGIKITNPDFDETKADTYIYTSQEIELVNAIAASQYFNKSCEDSTNIYLKLKVAIDKHYRADKSKQKNYLQMLYNITKNMGIQKEYEECIALCNQGILLSKEGRKYHYLSLFLFNKACSLLCLGHKEEGILSMSRAYALFLGVEDYSKMLQVNTFLKHEFGIDISELYTLLYFEPLCE